MKLSTLSGYGEEDTEDVGGNGHGLLWLLASDREFHTAGDNLPFGRPDLHLFGGYYEVQLHRAQQKKFLESQTVTQTDTTNERRLL